MTRWTMPFDEDGKRPWRIDAPTGAADGECVRFNGWIYASGPAVVELRRHVLYVTGRKVVKIGAWLRHSKPGMESSVARLFEPPHFQPSRKKMRSLGAESDRETRTEWTAGFSTFLFLLARLLFSKDMAPRNRAGEVLMSLLSWADRIMDIRTNMVPVLHEGTLSHCNHGDVADDEPCSHVQFALGRVGHVQETAGSQEAAAAFIGRLRCVSEGAELGDCPVLKDLLSAMLGDIAAFVEAAVISASPEDENPDMTLNAEVLRGNSRKLRMDEALMQSAKQFSEVEGVRDISLFLRGRGIDYSHWTKRLPLELNQVIAAQRLTWRGPGTWGMCLDGTRAGCPKEESVQYALYHVDSGTGGWTPLMATHVGELKPLKQKKILFF